MAKSAKAKKEKKKDFQKAKLKVGKTKAKASNFTDTSFKARSISVLQQSLATNAPSTVTQFNHHLALLGHKSEQQRLQSLSHLTGVLQNCRDHGIELPQPASVIVGKVQPLVRDPNGPVRTQVVKLLRCLPEGEVKAHTEGLLLWVRLGMTNLSAPVRMGALDVLEWLCEVAGHEAVSCPGGWTKTLKCFGGILGWDAPATVLSKDGKSSWTSTPNSSAKGTIDSKLLLKTLGVLTPFLEHGLLPPDKDDVDAAGAELAAKAFPLWHTQQHVLPIRLGTSNPYAYLDLYGAPKDEESTAYEDWEERAIYFNEKWRKSFDEGVMKVVREGGGVGRAAVGLSKVMKTSRELTSDEEDA
jgi:pre-rRNA-processing protein IPI1